MGEISIKIYYYVNFPKVLLSLIVTSITLYSVHVWQGRIVMSVSVCLFVCLQAYLRPFHQISCSHCQWPWLGPPAVALQFIILLVFFPIMGSITALHYCCSLAAILCVGNTPAAW